MFSVNRFTLDNGLRIVHHHDASTAMVALNLLYDTGARDEDPGLTGIAHLFEHLMFGGSDNVSDFDDVLTAAGGTNNAWTSADFTNFYEIAPAHNAETLFFIESDRMLHPTLVGRVLDVQRSVVVEEFKQQCLNRPYGDTMHHLRAMVYDAAHPYSWPVIGKTPEHISSVTPEQVIDWWTRRYSPDNAVLAISGNITFDEAQRLSAKWFGDIPTRPTMPRRLPEIADLTADVTKTVTGPVPSSVINIAWLMDPYGTMAYTAADAISDILSAGQASRFFRRFIIDGDGTFSDVDASITGSEHRGMFLIHATLTEPTDDPAALDRARQMLIDGARSIITEGVSEYELQRLKNRQHSQFVMSNLSYLSKASAMATAEMHHEDVDAQLNRYLALSTKDLIDTAHAIFDAPAATLFYLPK